MKGDLPSMATAEYRSTSYDAARLLNNMGIEGIEGPKGPAGWAGAPGPTMFEAVLDTMDVNADGHTMRRIKSPIPTSLSAAQIQLLKGQNMAPRRIVKVFIADTNESVPLEESLIFRSEEKFTDATDQELFFEIPIQEVLKAHNERRVKWRDKAIKDREAYLEPVRIRDLRMTVVTVASFN